MINPSSDIENSPTAIYELSKAYLKERDPTEYTFALKNFGSWSKWREFSEKEEWAPIINLWRDELAVKLRSEALSRILEAAQGETRDALSANKYIFETLEKDTSGKKVGRPSKEAIQKEASRLLEEDKLREEAYNRLFNNDA